MTEPSLNLGNGNWAGKSGNLLAYHKANNNFYADDLTFARASSGTRVNSSGLIETASVLSTTEEVTNGDFATNSDWTIESTWTISGGAANGNGASGSTQELKQTSVNTIGKIYKATFEVLNYVSGTVGFWQGSGISVIPRSANGTYTEYFTATSTEIRFRGTNFYGSIDNVSVKEVFQVNIPRVDYLNNSNGSLILEPQRTNLITYSEDFSQSYWSKSSITVTDGFTSPSGDLTASKFTEGSTNINHQIYRAIAGTAGNTYTLSGFFKKGERDIVQFIFGGAAFDEGAVYCNFDLENGVLGSGTYLDASITLISNGWYRCSLTATKTTTGNFNSTYCPKLTATSSRAAAYLGNGTSGIYAYGAQVEQGSYATTLINTSGSSVTRNADTCSITNVADRIGQTEGVFYWEGENIGEQFAPYLGLFADAPNTNNTRVMIYYTSETTLNTQVRLNGVIQFTSGNATANGRVKVALAYKENDFVLYVNGSKISESSSGSTFTNELNNFNFNSAICKNYDLKIYNTRLTNSELATLTT